jgi:hypothetical protein
MRNLLLFLGSLLVSLVLAEGVLHLVHPFDRMQTWIDMHDRGFVMNRAGGTAIHELDGVAVTYTFDRDRFRVSWDDPRVVPHVVPRVVPRADAIRADAIRPYTVLLGDSYAFGLHLPDSSTLAHRMGWRNFAVGGAGPADYLAQLETFPSLLEADTLLVLLSIDDATRTLAKDLYRLDGPSQRWRKTGFREAMEAIPGYHAAQKHSYLLNGFIRFAWPRWYFDDLSTPVGHGDSLYIAQLHTQIFGRMRDLCAASGCTLVLASNGYPAIQDVDLNQRYLMSAMPDIAKELGVRWKDCSPHLRNMNVILSGEATKDLQLPTDPHPSGEGIRRLARCF